MKELPNILFFTSEIPQSVNAGSMQLYRVLQGYPGDRIRVLGAPPHPDAELLPCKYYSQNLLTYRLACTRFRKWTSAVNATCTFFEPQMRSSLAMTVGFPTDLVVTVMDKLSYYKHAWSLSKRLGKPLLTITMDNPKTFESTTESMQWTFDRLLRRIYSDASLSLGVSDEMCKYLEESYGKKSTVFYFGPPDEMKPREIQSNSILRRDSLLTIGYAGSLGLGYAEGIRSLFPALEKTGAQLNLYTRDQHCIPKHPNVCNRGAWNPKELWPLVQLECDAVVLPYAHRGPITRVYETHFPTKLSEYCWLGMPILLSGPPFATGIRWGLKHADAALVATSCDQLIDRIQLLQASAEIRCSLATHSAKVAESEFDPTYIRHRFRELLQQSVHCQ